MRDAKRFRFFNWEEQMNSIINIATFVKVVEAGGFAAASRKLDTSPSLGTSSGRSGSGRRQLFAGLRDAQHFGKPEGESR
jgi:hypothetical protein